jgi:hypothetical protein
MNPLINAYADAKAECAGITSPESPAATVHTAAAATVDESDKRVLALAAAVLKAAGDDSDLPNWKTDKSVGTIDADDDEENGDDFRAKRGSLPAKNVPEAVWTGKGRSD